jgi:uncharacterized repeat protein (TIGR01451 family)
MRTGRGFKKLSFVLGLTAALALVVFASAAAATDGGSSSSNCPDVSIAAPLVGFDGQSQGGDCNNPCNDPSFAAPLDGSGDGGQGGNCNNPCKDPSFAAPLVGLGGDQDTSGDGKHGCGTVELRKHWAGANTGDSVDLKISTEQHVIKTKHVVAPTDGGTGPQAVAMHDSADVTLSETYTKGLSTDYTSTITCSNDKGPIVGYIGASFDGSVDLTVKKDDRVVCTITNSKIGSEIVPPGPDVPNLVGPPPAYDVQVTKIATSNVTLPAGGGSRDIQYGITVQNNGPNAVNNVVFTDAAPIGVTFTSVSSGKCVLAGNAVACSLGGFPSKASVHLTIWATVSAAGSYTNTGSAFGKDTDRNDTNLANNTSSATTVVAEGPKPEGPFTPPVVKPADRAIVLCNALVATPKVLAANGKKQVVKIHVTKLIGRTVASAKKVPAGGIRVLLTGGGINVTVITNSAGNAVANIAPSKAGVIKVLITNKKACNSQRLGAAGVYEPTVTG